jgi:preprotein translocase subunit YajC
MNTVLFYASVALLAVTAILFLMWRSSYKKNKALSEELAASLRETKELRTYVASITKVKQDKANKDVSTTGGEDAAKDVLTDLIDSNNTLVQNASKRKRTAP